ncbi:UNVERIFIED_CONTAM: hypothetical protein Slati_2668600 [Sesamum latifolium]|uniref:Reverse transcriptase zinc-binding domain-containing protein n=1 Tax=Sesamum latifolium TaxID=2727402 RepID=A0AAW2VV83_9LAMI
MIREDIAVVSREGATILSRPATLLNRVLKAKYFPTTTFEEAELGSWPSLTWRGICGARLLLKEGCRFITNEGWRWRFERMGRFSVKSAYRHAVTMRDRELASSSASGQLLTQGRGSLWSLIWRSGVPLKVKVLVWRLCKKALPTLVNLTRRAEGVDTTCAVCGMGSESFKHVFWECPFSRQVWALSNIAWHRLSTWTDGPRDWMLGVVQQVDREERGWVFTLCRAATSMPTFDGGVWSGTVVGVA